VIGNKVTYEGFSYYTAGYDKPEGWLPIATNTLDFNTLGTNTFDAETSTFIAPKTGYYRFRTHGFILTESTTGERVGIGLFVNGNPCVISGGQLSAVDSPGPQLSHVTHLQAGDTVRVYSYTPKAVHFGGGGAYRWWFQGEYVGK
jgi:hypothetical protein